MPPSKPPADFTPGKFSRVAQGTLKYGYRTVGMARRNRGYFAHNVRSSATTTIRAHTLDELLKTAKTNSIKPTEYDRKIEAFIARVVQARRSV
jgi:hypothetical protein